MQVKEIHDILREVPIQAAYFRLTAVFDHEDRRKTGMFYHLAPGDEMVVWKGCLLTLEGVKERAETGLGLQLYDFAYLAPCLEFVRIGSAPEYFKTEQMDDLLGTHLRNPVDYSQYTINGGPVDTNIQYRN